VRLTHEEALISALAIGLALGVTEYLSHGAALGILVGVGSFLVAIAVFRLVMRR
jgi:hypothetical protein